LKYLIEFIEAKNIKKSVIYRHLKCSEEEAKLVQYVCRRYVKGLEEVPVLEMLQENFRGEPYLYLKKRTGQGTRFFTIGACQYVGNTKYVTAPAA